MEPTAADPHASPPDGTRDYESVRARLRERGYLEGRLERFVLGDLLRAGSSPLRPALKAALLGGPLLGALLAAAAGAANRPLVRALDLGLLWLYFTPICALALMLLDLAAASWLGARARRRGLRPSDPQRAALLVGLPTALYLVALWWRQPLQGVAEELAFLGAAMLGVFVVARLAGLVSVAGILGRTGDVPRRGRRHGFWVVALLLLPLAGLIVVGRQLTRPALVAASPFEPGAGPATLLLGIDGLDLGLLDGLDSAAAGAVWRGLFEGGAVFPLNARSAADPPQVWTTLLSGMPATEHGVSAISVQRLPGIATALESRAGPLPLVGALRFLLPVREVPTNAVERQVLTLPEILGLKAPVAAVGWWASWPAVAQPGADHRIYVVTDRVLPKLLAGAAADRDTLPSGLFERLRADFDGDRAALRAAFDAGLGAGPEGELTPMLWESALIDGFAWTAGRRLIASGELRGAFLYLPGLDILRQRIATEFARGRSWPWREGEQALERYVAWLGEQVTQAGVAEPGWDLVVVGDPGRAGRGAGLVLLRGARVPPGCRGAPLAALDLVPLVLRLAGWPPSRELPGTAPRECGLDALPAREAVATFGRRPTDAGPAFSDYDPEMLERLRSLGYLN